MGLVEHLLHFLLELLWNFLEEKLKACLSKTIEHEKNSAVNMSTPTSDSSLFSLVKRTGPPSEID